MKEEKDLEQEEITLDEAPVEEEPETPADARTSESDEEADEEEGDDEDQESSDDDPSEEAMQRDPKKGLGRLFRNKWLLLSLAGAFSGILGIMLGYGVPLDLPWVGRHPEKSHREAKKPKDGMILTDLEPFFIPLSGNPERIAVKLNIKVRWEREALKKYRERPEFIRNDVLTYLLGVAESEGGLNGKKPRLELEIGEVLEHSLAVKKIKVTLDDVTPI